MCATHSLSLLLLLLFLLTSLSLFLPRPHTRTLLFLLPTHHTLPPFHTNLPTSFPSSVPLILVTNTPLPTHTRSPFLPFPSPLPAPCRPLELRECVVQGVSAPLTPLCQQRGPSKGNTKLDEIFFLVFVFICTEPDLKGPILATYTYVYFTDFFKIIYTFLRVSFLSYFICMSFNLLDMLI